MLCDLITTFNILIISWLFLNVEFQTDLTNSEMTFRIS